MFLSIKQLKVSCPVCPASPSRTHCSASWESPQSQLQLAPPRLSMGIASAAAVIALIRFCRRVALPLFSQSWYTSTAVHKVCTQSLHVCDHSKPVAEICLAIYTLSPTTTAYKFSTLSIPAIFTAKRPKPNQGVRVVHIGLRPVSCVLCTKKTLPR